MLVGKRLALMRGSLPVDTRTSWRTGPDWKWQSLPFSLSDSASVSIIPYISHRPYFQLSYTSKACRLCITLIFFRKSSLLSSCCAHSFLENEVQDERGTCSDLKIWRRQSRTFRHFLSFPLSFVRVMLVFSFHHYSGSLSLLY